MPNQKLIELAPKINDLITHAYTYFHSINIFDDNEIDQYFQKHAEEVMQAIYPELFELSDDEFNYLLLSDLLNDEALASFIDIITMIPKLVSKIKRENYIPLINKSPDDFFIKLLTEDDINQLSFSQLIKIYRYNKNHPKQVINLVINEIKNNGIDEIITIIHSKDYTYSLPAPLNHLEVFKTLLRDVPVSNNLIELLKQFIAKDISIDIECLDIIQTKYPELNEVIISKLSFNQNIMTYYINKAKTVEELETLINAAATKVWSVSLEHENIFTLDELKMAEAKGWSPQFNKDSNYNPLLKDADIINYYFSKIASSDELQQMLNALGNNIHSNKIHIKDSTVDYIIKYLDKNILESHSLSWYISTCLSENEKLLQHLLTNGQYKFLRFTKDSLFKKYINNALKTNPEPEFWQQMIDRIKHDENLQDCYNLEFYKITKTFFITKYHLNGEHLDIITNHFGYGILQVIENENIIAAINQDDVSFNKYITMLKEHKLTIDDVNNIYEVFLNLQFKREQSAVFNLFPQIKHTILNNGNINNIDMSLLYQHLNLERLITLSKNGEYHVQKYTYLCYLRNFFITLNESNQKEQFYQILKELAEGNEALKLIDKLRSINNTNPYTNYQLCEKFYNLFPQAQNPNNFNYVNNGQQISYQLYLKALQENPADFCNNLYETIKLADNIDKEKMLDIFNIITNENINATRAKFISDSLKKKQNTLDFNYKYDEKRKSDLLADEYLKTYLDEFWKNYHQGGFNLGLISEHPHYELFTNSEYLKACIDFITATDKKNYSFSENFPKEMITTRVRAVKEMISLLLEDSKFKYTLKSLLETDKLKAARRIDLSRQDSRIYEIMQSINIDSFQQNILTNPDVFNELCNQLEKYKLLEWGNIFTKMSIDVGCEYSGYTVATLINFYHKIHENLLSNSEEKRSQLMNLLTDMNIFSSVSNIYSILLGSENLRLIKLNPGPNSSSAAVNERINMILDYIKHLYLKPSLTVPSINEEINVGNNQQLRIVLGDITNTMNLTYGERTGSCMRIKGAGSSLFGFCLQNENAFHIRFENPDNGQFISRVSGFRNGNTVFLNELRHSVDRKYSDKQVIEACEKAAQTLIAKTANSACPIQNVVVHKAYAMYSSPTSEVPLNISSAKEGLPYFYSDIDTVGIVLASTNNKNLVPINFDKTNVEKYESLREPVVETESIEEILAAVNKINLIEKLINSNNAQDTTIITDNAFLKSWQGQDWYVVIDSNFNVITKNLNLDNRSDKEMAIAIAMAENYVAVYGQGKEIQHVQYTA